MRCTSCKLTLKGSGSKAGYPQNASIKPFLSEVMEPPHNAEAPVSRMPMGRPPIKVSSSTPLQPMAQLRRKQRERGLRYLFPATDSTVRTTLSVGVHSNSRIAPPSCLGRKRARVQRLR